MPVIWPIVLVTVANVIYQLCAKSVPEKLDPFASLTVSYTVGAVASAVLFFVSQRGGSFLKELPKLNWASIALGLAVVCMEAGYIYAYWQGWEISKASTIQSAFLSVALLVVGAVFFHEGGHRQKIDWCPDLPDRADRHKYINLCCSGISESVPCGRLGINPKCSCEKSGIRKMYFEFSATFIGQNSGKRGQKSA